MIEYFEIENDFHFASCKYETDDYNLGNKLFWKGYCFQTIEHMDKLNKNRIIVNSKMFEEEIIK